MALIDRRNQGLTYQLPRTTSMPAPQRPSATPIAPRPGSSPYAQMAANMANAKAAQQQQEEEGGSSWGRGLGVLVNNPVTRNVLRPLELLDYPRRATILGMEQAALALPDWAEALMAVPTMGVGGLTLAVDEDKVREDERSNWEKLKDPTYGFGQITADTGNKWVDRTAGLVGDILLDPVTYATFGTGAVAGKAGKASHLSRLTEKIGRAEALKALGFGDEAIPATLRNLGTMQDVEKMGRRGVGIATNAQLEAMGAGRQGLKLQMPFSSRVSKPFPHTEGLARSFNRGMGVVKEQANKLPGMERLRRTRHPIGFLGNDLGAAYERIITGQGSGTIEEALQAIEIDNIARRWGRRFNVVAADEVERLSQQLNKMSDAEVAALVRQAEVDGVENILTDTAERVRQAAADVGVDLPKLEAGLYAMPHVLTREARDAVLNLIEDKSPAATVFKRVTGITDQDLLQESGFLQRRRFVAGSEIPVGDGRKIVLETGSVDELNQKLGQLIPNFKGTLYETDPGAAWRAYLSGVTKDVAKRRAFGEAADRGFAGIFRQGDNPGPINPYVGRDTLATRTIGEGEDAVTAPLREFSEVPVDTRGNRYFRYVPNEGETKKMAKIIKAAHKDLVDEYATVGEARRLEIVEQLDDMADTMIHSVRSGLSAAKAEVDFYSRQVASSLAGAEEVRTSMNAVDRQLAEIAQEIDDLAKLRYGIERTARNRTTSQQADILASLQDAVSEAVATRRNLETFQEQMKVRARERAAEVDSLVRGKTMRQIEARSKELNDRVSHFRKRIEENTRRLRSQWKARNQGVDPGVVERRVQTAGEVVRRNPERLREFQRLENLDRITRRAIVDTRDFIDELAEQRDYLRRKSYKSTDDLALLDRLDQRTVDELQKLQKLEARATDLAIQLQHPNMGTVRVYLQNKAMLDDWNVYLKSNIEGDTNALGQAMRERDDFMRELTREAPQPAQAAKLTADEKGRLTRAQNYLDSNSNAKRWVRSEQQVLDAQRLKLNKERLESGGLLISDGRTPSQVRKDARVADKWMKEHPGVGRNVRKARATVRDLEAKQRQVAPPPRQAPRGEFFDQLDRTAATEQRQLSDIARLEQRIESDVMPQIADTQRAEAEARAGIGRMVTGTNPDANEAMLANARDYFGRNAEIQQERVGLEAARKQAQEVRAELDETMSALGASYRENYTNLRAARAEHEAIKDRLTTEQGRLDYGVRKADEIGARPPYKTSLGRVTKGETTSFEAQPLARTVADLQALVEANPTLNDPLMNRMEAQLATIEQQLANLTDEVDLPRAEAQRLLTAARNGELQPVMQAVLRDGWRQLWDNGDVVISSELEARYHRIVNMLAEPKAMGKVMTAYTNFFKTYATLSPGFHVRNGMSATFMNYSEGVPTRTQLRGISLWRDYAKAPDPQAWLRSQRQDVQRAFEAAFASGSGGRFFESGVADPGAGAGRLKEAIFSNPLTRKSQQVGQDWVEGPVRLALALHSIDQGGSVTDALNRITRIHFDYSQVSQFDEKAKRFIPFWTFMSRNLPMQVTQMWSKPRTYQKYNSFVRNFSMTPDEYTPEYILEAGGFDTGEVTQDWMPGTNPGIPIFLQPDFAHTRLGEDASKIENVLSGGNFGQLLSDFNPALTAPIEYATGQDLFTGRRYQPDDYRKASGVVDNALLPLMAILGQTKRGEDGDIFYQEKGFDALRSLIPILDRTTRLAPTTAGGTMDERQMESVLRFLGAPIRTVTDEQRRNEQRSRYYDRLDERDLQRVLAGG